MLFFIASFIYKLISKNFYTLAGDAKLKQFRIALEFMFLTMIVTLGKLVVQMDALKA
jgi:hypothetical protein